MDQNGPEPYPESNTSVHRTGLIYLNERLPPSSVRYPCSPTLLTYCSRVFSPVHCVCLLAQRLSQSTRALTVRCTRTRRGGWYQCTGADRGRHCAIAVVSAAPPAPAPPSPYPTAAQTSLWGVLYYETCETLLWTLLCSRVAPRQCVPTLQ